MSILEVVNTYWPDTIAKLGLTQEALPEGMPFMGVFVELFEGAVLPTEAETSARIVEYQAFLANDAANSAIKKQIAALEEKQTTRRMSEAVLGIDNGWLANIRAQITELRNSLT